MLENVFHLCMSLTDLKMGAYLHCNINKLIVGFIFIHNDNVIEYVVANKIQSDILKMTTIYSIICLMKVRL